MNPGLKRFEVEWESKLDINPVKELEYTLQFNICGIKAVLTAKVETRELARELRNFKEKGTRVECTFIHSRSVAMSFHAPYILYIVKVKSNYFYTENKQS